SHDAYTASASVLRVARLVRSSGEQRDARIEPYHDRVRETVTGRLSAEQRRALHRRFAEILEGNGEGHADPRLLVDHLEGAGFHDRAARRAEAAADRACAALAFDQ